MRVLSFFLAASSLWAGPLLVETSGVFSAATPNSFFTAPGGAWTLSFVTDSNPQLSNQPMLAFFDPYTSFKYTLNGSPVPIGATEIKFYDAVNMGLFDVCFVPVQFPFCSTNGFSFQGPQVYLGLTNQPTILTGTYPTSGFSVVVAGTSYRQPNTTVTITAIPEPGTCFLLAAGVLLTYKRHGHRAD